MILDRYIYPLDKIYSEAVGVLYPVCGAQNDVPPTPPTPEPQELVDFYWGVWADDDNRPNYFSTTLSFSEREINLSELPEGWYGKAITDYGEVVVNANDIVFGNALDIPHDDSDLTNLVNYTGEDQTLATSFEIYDANDNLLYYIASTDVEIVRAEVINFSNVVLSFDERIKFCWAIDFDVVVSGIDYDKMVLIYTDKDGDTSEVEIEQSYIVNNHVRLDYNILAMQGELSYLPFACDSQSVILELRDSNDTVINSVELNNWTTDTPFGDMHIILNTQGPTGYNFNAEIQCTRAMSDAKYNFTLYDNCDDYGNPLAYLPMIVDPQDNTKLIMNGGDNGQFVDPSLQDGQVAICVNDNIVRDLPVSPGQPASAKLPTHISYYVTDESL